MSMVLCSGDWLISHTISPSTWAQRLSRTLVADKLQMLREWPP